MAGSLMAGSLTGLNVHPLKSGAIRPLTGAQVLPRGLADDRSWVVVGSDGVMVSARTDRRLFRVVADTPATSAEVVSGLRLTAPGLDPLAVPVPSGDLSPVRIHSNDLFGVDAGEEAARWIGRALERTDVRLLWCDDPTRRTLNPAFSVTGDHTAFADAYPVTVANEASLAQLNDWITAGALERGEEPPAPLPITRFRANLVVSGLPAFAEDDWQELRVGEVSFRRAKPVGRCSMTTIDPRTLAHSKEPIRTLARHRLVEGNTLFALHLVPLGPGRVRLGDVVEGR